MSILIQAHLQIELIRSRTFRMLNQLLATVMLKYTSLETLSFIKLSIQSRRRLTSDQTSKTQTSQLQSNPQFKIALNHMRSKEVNKISIIYSYFKTNQQSHQKSKKGNFLRKEQKLFKKKTKLSNNLEKWKANVRIEDIVCFKNKKKVLSKT